MTASEFFTLLKCGPRLIAAVATGNEEAFDNTVKDIEAAHAAIDARKAGR
jgi:hypothetical protein